MKTKKIFLVAVFMIVFIVPTLLLASDYVGGSKGFGIMEAVEKKIVGVQAHEEMEDLMKQMMDGSTRSDEEIEKIANKLAEITNKYPGAMNMMMNRFVSDNVMNSYERYGHMGMMGGWGTDWGSFWFLIMSVGSLAWVAVGVLLATWLFKQVVKK